VFIARDDRSRLPYRASRPVPRSIIINNSRFSNYSFLLNLMFLYGDRDNLDILENRACRRPHNPLSFVQVSLRFCRIYIYLMIYICIMIYIYIYIPYVNEFTTFG